MEGIIKNQRDNHHQHHAEHVGVEAFVVVNSKSVTKTDSVADGFIARTGALYCYQLPHTSCIATAMVFIEYHLMQDRQMNKKDLSPAFLKAFKKYEEFVWELEDDNPVGGWNARANGCCVGTHKRCCRSTCATPMGHPAQRPHQRALETMTHKVAKKGDGAVVPCKLHLQMRNRETAVEVLRAAFESDLKLGPLEGHPGHP
uniref:Uncharacterized protein n=1 Tax=Branchiostoma floridae TaxID=7739 RepID=C3ZB10_BRAFL|eukprot:XP_002594036.1 hypothetical protein BRAFLDRAFT_68524 [Branchiostoma floridae]